MFSYILYHEDTSMSIQFSNSKFQTIIIQCLHFTFLKNVHFYLLYLTSSWLFNISSNNSKFSSNYKLLFIANKSDAPHWFSESSYVCPDVPLYVLLLMVYVPNLPQRTLLVLLEESTHRQSDLEVPGNLLPSGMILR